MSNLIIGIIAIALVVVLSSAGFFYGGKVYSTAKADAEVVKYLNESSQVESAYKMYKSKGNAVTTGFTINTLVDDGYLKSIPEGWGIYSGTLGTPIAGNLSLKEQVCYSANLKSGYDFNDTDNDVYVLSYDETKAIPYCNNAEAKSAPCCYQ